MANKFIVLKQELARKHTHTHTHSPHIYVASTYYINIIYILHVHFTTNLHYVIIEFNDAYYFMHINSIGHCQLHIRIR